MKTWLLRISGAIALLLLAVFIYIWTAGFALVTELWHGTPFFLEHAGHQVQVSTLGALCFLVVGPVLLGAFSVWSFRSAARTRQSAA